MQLALTDQLRCTAAHAETWLVARADVAEHGWMVDGVLGCPVCHLERAVRAGVVIWNDTHGATPAGPSGATVPDDDASVRVAALLAFSDSHAPFLLCGVLGVHAAALGGMATAPLVLLDPPDDSAAGLATIIRGTDRMPFADRSVQGIALDAVHAAAGRIDWAVRALVPTGRMVANADVPVPTGIREMARDDVQWVGEREQGPDARPPISISRGRR